MLNGWILPTGGVASGSVYPAACAAGLFLVFQEFSSIFWLNIFIFQEFRATYGPKLILLRLPIKSVIVVKSSNSKSISGKFGFSYVVFLMFDKPQAKSASN